MLKTHEANGLSLYPSEVRKFCKFANKALNPTNLDVHLTQDEPKVNPSLSVVVVIEPTLKATI